MEDFELVGPNGTDVNNEFIKQYRDALRNQYDASVSALKQQNRNNQASIMSAANEKGMMYSNFPQRSKIQAETDYLKNMSKLHSTYQTGLDKLRGNAVNAYNQIKAYEEAIADLDELSGGSGGTTGTTGTPGTNPSTTGDPSDTAGDPNNTTSGGQNSYVGYNMPSNSGNNAGITSKILGGITGSTIGGIAGTILSPYLGLWAPVAGAGLGAVAGYDSGDLFQGKVTGRVGGNN